MIDDHKGLWLTIYRGSIFLEKMEIPQKMGQKNRATKYVSHTQIVGQNIVFFSAETTCKMGWHVIFLNASGIVVLDNNNKKMRYFLWDNIFQIFWKFSNMH